MLAAVVVTSVLWARAGAAAAPDVLALPVELRWDAPSGCPDAASVRAAVARGVPAPPPGVEIAPVAAEVVVTAPGGRWRAAVALRGLDWSATRLLKGPTCVAVADAAALIIDLALATELQTREAAGAPTPPPPPTRPRLPSRATPVLGLGATGDVGTLPAAGGGAVAVLGWRSARMRVDVRGSWFASRAGTVPGEPDVGARVGLWSASLRACRLGGATLVAGVCADAGLDHLDGTAFGAITPTPKTGFAPFLGAGLQGEWRLSRWVVPFVSVEAAIPLVRTQISIQDVGPVHRAAAVSFRGAAGIEVPFR